jgi:hypothetical protein
MVIMATKEKTVKVMSDHGPMGWVLFMAYIGAAVYFVQQSAGFWGFILALLKAAVWPAYVLYHALNALQV